MIIEPESLVACLIVHIACSSLHGCSAHQALGHAQKLLRDSSRPANFSEARLESDANDADKAFARTVWQWLTSRRDVSVGRKGEWNHLSLDELLSLPDAPPSSTVAQGQVEASSGPDGSGALEAAAPGEQTGSGLPPYQPKLFVSEDRAWESIAGHGVDHQRVPKSQWEALLGIASAGEEGIIQGDLRRLIGQDKRSLPHRTDVLAQRGYVVKRTTLIRGCKTSKLWLKRFAPDLPRNTLEPEEAGFQEGEEMAGEDLTAGDSPVPWHHRWTNGPIDMIALGQTIMAIVKAWGVMRFYDLKAKLGVNGRQWEMRVVARSCRFLAMRGCLKYVVATWDGRLLRDCVKFSRDLGPEDWAALLCTGMLQKKLRSCLARPTQNSKPSTTSVGAKKTEGVTVGTAVAAAAVPKPASTRVVWSPDEPLCLTISRLVLTAGEDGYGTPELVHMTLGPSFRRYVSSASTALASRGVQPPHLKHLEISRELRRAGKAAVFRFFSAAHATVEADAAADAAGEAAGEKRDDGKEVATGTMDTAQAPSLSPDKPSVAPVDPFDFGTPVSAPAFSSGNPKLEAMATDTGAHYLGGASAKRRKEPKSRGRSYVLSHAGSEGGDAGSAPDREPGPAESSAAIKRGRGRPSQGDGAERGKKGRGRKAASATSSGKYKCEKCGNSWKNDVGLKYHVTKARTPCNPSYVDEGPPALRLPRGLRPTRPSQSTQADTEVGADLGESGAIKSGSEGVKGHEPHGHLGTPTPSTRSTFATPKEIRQTGQESVPYVPVLKPVVVNAKAVVSGPEQGLQDDAAPSPSLQTRWRRSELTGPAPQDEAGSHSLARGSTSPPARAMSSTSQPAPEASQRAQKKAKQTRQVVRFHDDPVSPSPGPRRQPTLASSSSPAPPPALSRPITPAASAVHAPTPAGTPPTSTLKAFPMPVVEPNKRRTPEQIVSSRVSAIILWLVDCLGGVFPGGKALWISIGTAWRHYFAGDPCPPIERFAIELRRLLSKRLLFETSHSFRDPKSTGRTSGLVSCQVIASYNSDPDKYWLSKVVEAMKLAYPMPYVPEFMREALPPVQDGHCPDPVLTFSGRRMIVGKVEVLRAPFYASGPPARKSQAARPSVPGTKRLRLNVDYSRSTAADRQGESVEGSEQHGRGRRLRRREGAATAAASTSPLSSSANVIWADDDSEMDSTSPRDWLGYADQDDDDDLLAAGDSDENSELLATTRPSRPVPKVRFLKPNTYLEKSYTESHGPDAFLDSGGNSDGNDGSTEQPGADNNAEDAVDKLFAPATHLELATHGDIQCPSIHLKWFEAQDCSFTVNMWTPDRAWLDLENFPILVNALLFRRLTQLAHRRGGLSVDAEGAAHRRFIEKVTAIHHVEMRPQYLPPRASTCGWPWRVFVPLENSAVYPVAQRFSSLQWNDDDQLTIESAPRIYTASPEAESAEDSDWEPQSIGRRRRRRPAAAARGSQHHNKHWRARPPAKDTLKHRFLTPLPDPEEGAPALVTTPAPVKEKRKREKVLLAAFVVVRTLLGGTGEAIDWGLMLHLFPEENLDGLRRCWARCRKFRSDLVSNLTAKFRRAFIRAYERDEIPAINYDDPHAYDWMGLVKWTLAIPVEEDVQLPVSRASLGATHSLRNNPARQPDDWRDKYFHPQASVFSRLEAATSEAAALSLRGGAGKPPADPGARLARSLVKALSGTPSGRYTSAEVKAKFAPFKIAGDGPRPPLLERAVRDLLAQKTISKTEKDMHSSPHPYRLSELFHSTLAKLGQAKKYREAAQFKSELDAAVSHHARLRLPYNVPDGATMAYINLQASHRVAIQPVGVPEVPLGFEPGRYETRKFSKKYYRFGLEIAATAAYLPTDAVAVVAAAIEEHPPIVGPFGEVPVWCDLFGVLDQSRWAHLIAGLLFIMATRGSPTVASICRAMKPLVEDFEVELLIDWAKKVGVMESTHDGAGLAVTGWWWLVAAALYEDKGASLAPRQVADAT